MKRPQPPPTLNDLIDRAAIGVTELATAAGVTPRALLNLREGRIARPRSQTVGRLAKALGVDAAAVRAAIAASRAASS